MAGRHLHELLREEQEPFALKSFIDERRRQLWRPSSKRSPSSQHHQHHHHLQIKRHTSPVLESRAFSPSALVKSPSSPFGPFREHLDGKRSPLLHLPREKSPSPASRLTAALLLEAAVRIQKQQDQQQQQQSRKKRRKRKKKEGENPSKRFGLGFLASVLKKLVVKKRQRGITGEDEDSPFSAPVKDLLKWETPCGDIASPRAATQMVRYPRRTEADLDTGNNPHYGLQSDGEKRNEDEGEKCPQSSICGRCGIPECPQNDGAASPSGSNGGTFLAGRVSSSSPSRHLPGASARGGPSSEVRTPAGSPDRRSTELLGGTGDEGRAEPSYYEEKKEQFSPVSVLDPPFDEEDHHHNQQHDDHSHHSELEPQEELEGEREEDDVDLDSFEHSLAIVQRAKQQLLSRLRRFERLAELDPVELERRLAEEDEDEDDDGGCDEPENAARLRNNIVEMEAPDVCELVQVALGFCGGAGRKIPADMRRLVLDLADEVRTGPVAARKNGVEKMGEGVRRKLRAWNGVESNTIDMMVEMDLRQEGDGWTRFPEQVEVAAAGVDAAVFALLVDELTEEFAGPIN